MRLFKLLEAASPDKPHEAAPLQQAVHPMLRLVRAASDLPRQSLMLLVRSYRLLLKPWLGNACRFEPSCSAYTLQALQRHGALRGSALGGWRLLRCQPWCEAGHDPVPAHFSFIRAVRHRLEGACARLGWSAGSSAPAASTFTAPEAPEVFEAATLAAPPPAGLFTGLLNDASSSAAPDSSVSPVSPRTSS